MVMVNERPNGPKPNFAPKPQKDLWGNVSVGEKQSIFTRKVVNLLESAVCLIEDGLDAEQCFDDLDRFLESPVFSRVPKEHIVRAIMEELVGEISEGGENEN